MKIADSEMKEHHEHRMKRHSRIRRTKKFLRPLPRRATLHRWPILKRFAQKARSKPYLWSFRVSDVSPAIYLGCMMAYVVPFGIQVVVAFFAAMIFRCNLLVTTALLFITNPATVWFIYPGMVYLGNYLIDIWGLEFLVSENMYAQGSYAFILGGIIFGLVSGLVIDLIYRLAANRYKKQSVNLKKMLKN